MEIAIGADHAGFEFKEQLKDFLLKNNYKVKDFGAHTFDKEDGFPDYASPLAKAIGNGEYDRGILVCGSGIGVSIAANKVKGAYAALLTDVYSAERSALSNNSNIACFGAFTLGTKLVEELTKVWLSHEFEPGCASQPKVDRYREYDMNR